MTVDLVAFLKEILPALTQIAKLSTTTIDDTVVEFVGLVLSNDAVAHWLQSLIDGGLKASDLAGQATIDAPEAVHAALRDRKIDWNNVVTNILPAVLKIIALFAK